MSPAQLTRTEYFPNPASPTPPAAFGALPNLEPEEPAYTCYGIDDSVEYENMHGKILVGPDGFECCLGEPEDCSWYRDGNRAMKRLNEQLDEINYLKAELAKFTDA